MGNQRGEPQGPLETNSNRYGVVLGRGAVIINLKETKLVLAGCLQIIHGKPIGVRLTRFSGTLDKSYF
jgi:hypothetical protein